MNKYAARETASQRKIRWTGVLLLLTFLISGLIAYPTPWNTAMKKVDEMTGYHLPYLPEIEYRLGLDLQGGAHLVYEADMSSVPEADRADALAGVRDVVERRVNAFGVAEPIVQTTIKEGHYRVIVDLPGVTDVRSAVQQIGETPVLTFRVPDENPSLEATPEQEQQIAEAQAKEREAALAVLDRALDGEDFAALAKEFSIDTSTKENGGSLGLLTAEDPEYGGLIKQIEEDGLRRGVIDGLYEGTSRMHVMEYNARKVENEPLIHHILICYQGAERCEQTRTKEEALALATDLQDQATRDNFAELAKTNSNDPGSAAEGGSLGFVRRGEMVEPFEAAAYALRNGRISDVVETEFGYHVLYRETSQRVNYYDLSHIEMPWTTLSDVYVVDPWKNTELSGRHVKHASVAFDPNTGAPYVVLDFNSEGADLFATLTEENIGQIIGIFLDGEAITTPVVQQAIYGGQASITGSMTIEGAKLLAQRLNAGALPVPISVVSQQTIGPALGQESLDKSVTAGLLGFALIALFMIVYYRLPGLFASLALVFYAAINLMLYKLFDVTVTLSGIAGFVLSLGIAVDANVLIFERLKEELRSGRDLPSAIEEAFSRAWPSIRDGNLTTLIATSVLYVMSAGFIRGFALTLSIGVLVSMFSAMTVTRVLLRLVSKKQALRKPLFFLGYDRK